jgi:O-acetyl-ADP-ribose deacetylase (regulator of RNase III)
MLEEKGNIWEYSADAICITTNGIVGANGCLIMGKGIALDAKKEFPNIDRLLGQWVLAHGNVPCFLWPQAVISFPTKNHWRLPSCPLLIADTAVRVVKLADAFGLKKVALPRPGCGNGGLSWEGGVQNILRPILDDRFVVLMPPTD